MAQAQQPAKARFKAIEAGNELAVLINPASVKVTMTNRLQEPEARQQSPTTTSKLEMDLVFDTTEDGRDVREDTGQLKEMAVVPGEATTKPPRVRFTWGRFAYEGVIESLGETLEFWSSEGVPLRALVQLAISGVGADTVAAGAENARAAIASAPQGGFGATDVARQAGDPGAGRQVAAVNGLESMRMIGGGAVAVGGGVQLKAAAGFKLSAGAGASVGFGFGASAGGGAAAGFGAGAGAGFGASAGAGFGASAGAGIGAAAGAATAGAGFSAAAGGGASAGVSASAGAFAGLGPSKTPVAFPALRPERLLPPPAAPLVTSGSSFDVTGKVAASGSAGLTADVNGRRVYAEQVRF